MEKKIIAVVGATGAQGGGLVRAIAADPSGEFAARAITRDVRSEKAARLRALGVEVMAADLDDRTSLKRAFAGAYGAFCVTFFWDHLTPERELAQAESMVAAATTAGLEHVVWSTLEDTRANVPLDDDRMPTLMDRYKVPHWDAKGEADAFFVRHGVPTTFLLTSFYYENFVNFGLGPVADASGRYAFGLPIGDRKLAMIGAEDIGRCAYGIFNARDAYLGSRVGIAAEHLTGAEIAERFGRVLGRPVAFDAIDPVAYRASGIEAADELANMFQYDRDFETECLRNRPIDFARALNPALEPFDAWLARNVVSSRDPASAPGH